MVDLHQNYLVFEVDAIQQNELFNSIVVRGARKRGGGHMGGSCILHLGVGVIKMMEDVLDQINKRRYWTGE
jgi:hypothetical protein